MAFDVAKKEKSILEQSDSSPKGNRRFLAVHSLCSLMHAFINTFLLRTYCVPDIILGAGIMFLELGVVTDRQVFI